MRIRLVVAYVGTSYMGWQVQAERFAMQTIQGQLEHALGLLAAAPVRVHGSGRTDSGVHAEGQVAHCDFPEARFAKLKDMRHALNAMLPDDIRVFVAEPCAQTFHARFSAHAKTYRYQFWMERGFVPPRLKPYVWCCGPLDVARMREALPHLQGEHKHDRGHDDAQDPQPQHLREEFVLRQKIAQPLRGKEYEPCGKQKQDRSAGKGRFAHIQHFRLHFSSPLSSNFTNVSRF